MKKFQKIFFKSIIVISLMIASSIGTMFYCIGLPADEQVWIQNRALNYLEKDCYDMEDIEMIVFGEVLYDNRD